MNLDAPHTAVAEMERQMGINEDVLRFLTIRSTSSRKSPPCRCRRKSATSAAAAIANGAVTTTRSRIDG
jgi:ribosomal protein S6